VHDIQRRLNRKGDYNWWPMACEKIRLDEHPWSNLADLATMDAEKSVLPMRLIWRAKRRPAILPVDPYPRDAYVAYS
jgi:hypothetical protein